MAINLKARDIVTFGDHTNRRQMKLHIPAEASAEKPGILIFGNVDGSGSLGTGVALWADNAGNLRFHTSIPTDEDSDGSVIGTSTGATTALSNLASVAINTTLKSDTDSTDDLGTSAVFWANSYIDRMYVNATAYIDGATAGKLSMSGNVDISGNLAVTGGLTYGGSLTVAGLTVDAVVAATTNGTITVDGNGSGGVNICSTSTGGITLGDDVGVASAKVVTIAGTAAATDYLVITAGSFQMTDGNIDMDEGKLEIDTTTDETTYVKRNKTGASSAVVEIEVTHTGDTGSALLLDHNGTGAAKCLEISHNGDGAAIDISAAAARTGNVISIAMANALAQTALDITGAATGTSGEGIIHVDVTGVLAGNAIRVDSTGANAATGQLLYLLSTGKQAGACDGICAYLSDTGAQTATSYALYVNSTNNDGVKINTGAVTGCNLTLTGLQAQTAKMLNVDANTGTGWVGADNVGAVDISHDGVLVAGANLLRVASSGNNTAASYAVEIATSGNFTNSTGGAALRVDHTGTAGGGTVYAVYINSSNDEALHVDAGKVLVDETVQASGGLITKVAITDVADPPTQANMVTAFGAAADAGAGFIGMIDDANGGVNEWVCISDGSNWFYLAKATVGA